ncbi:MAG: hypothetical protein QOJ07_1073, partial [Thermoleophilaceae bacterium]|nr:hypothetical protein [Thermoleophilaceae bacterium]
ALRRRSGGEVAVYDERGRLLTATDLDTTEATASRGAALQALSSEHTVRRIADGSEHEALVAVTVEAHERRLAVTVTKSLDDARAAVSRVRRTFVIAALAGLGVALLVGVLVATGLVRRLRELRRATLKIADLGPEAVLTADPRRDEVGDLTRAFVTLQGRLREQEQARRTFVATASHELRTPLASLTLMLDMLEEDLGADGADIDDARGRVAAARGQSDRLSKLAAELLDLSRIDAGIPLSDQLVDLGELCRAVLAEFEPRSPGALELSAAEGCWAVADPGATARIVRILVDNALRFAPAGEPVRVAASCAEGRAEVAVADGGPGVPEAERELIFERFQRGSETGDTAGFGLGLAIGRELAHRMGGDLTLDDTADGGRFVLTLRVAPAES